MPREQTQSVKNEIALEAEFLGDPSGLASLQIDHDGQAYCELDSKRYFPPVRYSSRLNAVSLDRSRSPWTRMSLPQSTHVLWAITIA